MSKECFREEEQMWNQGNADIKESKKGRGNGERQPKISQNSLFGDFFL